MLSDILFIFIFISYRTFLEFTVFSCIEHCKHKLKKKLLASGIIKVGWWIELCDLFCNLRYGHVTKKSVL